MEAFPSLIVRLPDGDTRNVPLFKRLISVGKGPDNDVVLALDTVGDTAMHLQYDGAAWSAVAVDGPFLHNGKKRREAKLADKDRLRLAEAELEFVTTPPPQEPDVGEHPAVAILRRLYRFSETVLGKRPLGSVLEELMDAAVELSGAEKGMLILLENDELRVAVARNLEGRTLADAEGKISDTIVNRVLEEQRPLIISDALADGQWSTAASVVNLRLCSVMCAPLFDRGELFGLIYLGNDSVANLFEERDLELLTLFASLASLLLQNARLLSSLELDNEELRRRLDENRYGEVLGSCKAMQEIYRTIDKVAKTDVSVLLVGETGTGKEVLARELHRRSNRSQGPFVAINCGAIPENLLESDLFGHVKGAFTGAAHSRQGKFQAAAGGTLFLDEIGEMPLHLQVKILRALQEREVTRVGDTRPEPVDIRVLAATHRNLEEEIAAGRFREDLYYRLNVVTLAIPPLRERGDDVIVLARYFLAAFTKELGAPERGLSPAAVEALRKHRWSGNVRELENRIKRAVVLAEGALIGPADLDLGEPELEPILPLQEAKEEFQRRYINEVLARNDGNRTQTAKDLGVDPRTIFRHLEAEREREGGTR